MNGLKVTGIYLTKFVLQISVWISCSRADLTVSDCFIQLTAI
ncbi:MAG: hypothetical protein RLY17_1627 [Pseudomonadota bacterium]|jgi:hypothetical protein